MDNPQYPEHAKLDAAKERLGTEHIGGFLQWLEDQRMAVCYLDTTHRESNGARKPGWRPVQGSIHDLLARYAGINPTDLEAERRAMVEEPQAAHRQQL